MFSVFVSAFVVTSFFTACGAGKLNDEAEKTSAAFYASLQQKDYPAALLLCSDKAFVNEGKEKWVNAFQKNAGLLGKLVSYKQTSGFNIQASTTAGTTVKLAYDVEWQYGKSKDSVFLIKENDGSMKVYHYSWQHSNTTYLEALNQSEAAVIKYVDAVKSHDFSTAVGFCSEEALQITPKDKWAGFLTSADNRYGAIQEYKIMSDSSRYNIEAQGQAGKGNYYDVFVLSKRNGTMVKEKIVFYQKNYEEPVRLTGHYFL